MATGQTLGLSLRLSRLRSDCAFARLRHEMRPVVDRRRFIGMLAGGLLAAPFSAARAANTRAQDRALEAWNACTTGPTTARLDLIEAKGRIHFHYSGPSDGARMTACPQEKRVRFRASPGQETGKSP